MSVARMIPGRGRVRTPGGGVARSIARLVVDYDEPEIAGWLLVPGMDPNLRSAIAAGGFGAGVAPATPTPPT